MTREDDYRANAEEAQKQADRATSELDRATWLRMAQEWLGLLRRRPRTDDDAK